ncbi:hypothetical protein M378DRAFT_102521 [Amanita muscaria Koide BX008]|uniref:3-keto sterol reductase n=1 Tax=Amanita muscaria (strain Koide BX008) TaxID=946122 RepID=A0A0C2XD24_AMAMK|nr:hypothetical protein M378DRAFT_102521 [Amanita muscaria Koide BX008]
MSSPWPIVIVTGANGGVGFGICQRLLSQLCLKQPRDAQLQPLALSSDNADVSPPFSPCDGMTLIMACRSIKRAEAARVQLLNFLDARVAYLKTRPHYDGHAETFRKNVDIVVTQLDLAEIASVLRFADQVVSKYPYVSHLICNAGLASFSRLDWPVAIKETLLNPGGVPSRPVYIQHKGEESVDGFGWVWQCNFFGHFVLFRALESSLSKSPSTSRVVWMSSIEASPIFYNSEDWQCKVTDHSYESSKYQIDLIGNLLDRLASQDPTLTSSRHFVVQPGIVSTSISDALVGPLLNFVKLLSFYLARFLGSPHHTISPFKAAIPAVHVALAPLIFIIYLSGVLPTNSHISHTLKSQSDPERLPVRFGAETDWWGNERVGLTPVKEWNKFEKEAECLLERCNTLYETVKVTKRDSSAGS